MTARIVVVDDDHAMLGLLDTLLTEAGYHRSCGIKRRTRTS